jgi:hypothetical protein
MPQQELQLVLPQLPRLLRRQQLLHLQQNLTQPLPPPPPVTQSCPHR